MKITFKITKDEDGDLAKAIENIIKKEQIEKMKTSHKLPNKTNK